MAKSSKTPPDYDHIVEMTRAEFAPENVHERFLVDTMAHARWKLLKIEQFRAQAVSQGEIDETNPKLVALDKYAGAAQKSYNRAYKELLKSRKQKRRNEPKGSSGPDFAYRA
jgi:hypothetical protein